MKPPRIWLKEGVYGALFLLKRSEWSGFRAILCYHCVGINLPWGTPLGDFRRQMAYLKSNYQVAPLRDFRDRARSNGSRGLVAITFDDGALDNYTQALPILEDLGLKATFFIVTGCIGGQFRGRCYETPMMNLSQVREMAALGHEIGSHSVHHVSMKGLERASALCEMLDSKHYLEDLTARPVDSFCYPFGEYDAQACACAREAGFRYAATTDEGLVPQQGVDWWALPRVGVDACVGMMQFRGKLSPAVELYEKLRGRRPSKDGRA